MRVLITGDSHCNGYLDTRSAITLSVSGVWSSDWCWFYAGRDVAGQSVQFDLPRSGEAEPLHLGLKPDEGMAGALAASENSCSRHRLG